MVQQIDAQLHSYLKRAKCAICITLHRGAQVQEIHYVPNEHQATIRRDTEVLYSNKEAFSIDKANDRILVATFTNDLRKGKFLFSL